LLEQRTFLHVLITLLWKLEMDQSYENENRINDNETCEIFMNDVIMEEMKKV
jgi:hypothetical protein